MKKMVKYGIQKNITSINLNDKFLINPFFKLKKKKNKVNPCRSLNFCQNEKILLNFILSKKEKKAIYSNFQKKNTSKRIFFYLFKKSKTLLKKNFLDSQKKIEPLSIVGTPFYFKTKLIKEYLKTSNKPFPIIINKLNQNIRKKVQKQTKITKISNNLLLLLTKLKLSYILTYSKNPLMSEIYILKLGNFNLNYYRLAQNQVFFDKNQKKSFLFHQSTRIRPLTIIFGKNTKMKNGFNPNLKRHFINLINKSITVIEEIQKKNLLNQNNFIHFCFYLTPINFWLLQNKRTILVNLIVLINLYNKSGKNWSPYLIGKKRYINKQCFYSMRTKKRLVNSRKQHYEKFKQFHDSLNQQKKNLYQIIWSWLIKRFSKLSMLSIATRYWLFLSTHLLLKSTLNMYLLEKVTQTVKLFRKNNFQNKTKTMNSKELLFRTYARLVTLTTKQRFNYQWSEKEGYLKKANNQRNLRKKILYGFNYYIAFQSKIYNLSSIKKTKEFFYWSVESQMYSIEDLRYSQFNSWKVNRNNQCQIDIDYFDFRQKINKFFFQGMKFKDFFFYYTNYQPLSTSTVISKKLKILTSLKKTNNNILFINTFFSKVFCSFPKSNIYYANVEVVNFTDCSIDPLFQRFKKRLINVQNNGKKKFLNTNYDLSNLWFYKTGFVKNPVTGFLVAGKIHKNLKKAHNSVYALAKLLLLADRVVSTYQVTGKLNSYKKQASLLLGYKDSVVHSSCEYENLLLKEQKIEFLPPKQQLENLNNMNFKDRKKKIKKFKLPQAIQKQSQSELAFSKIKLNNKLDLKTSENKKIFLSGLTSYLLTYKRKKSFLKLKFLNITEYLDLSLIGLNYKKIQNLAIEESLQLKKPFLNTKGRNTLHLLKIHDTFSLTNKIFPFGFSLYILNKQKNYIEQFSIYYEKKGLTILNSLFIFNNVQNLLNWSVVFHSLKRTKERRCILLRNINIKLNRFYSLQKITIVNSLLYAKEKFIQSFNVSLHLNTQCIQKSINLKTRLLWSIQDGLASIINSKHNSNELLNIDYSFDISFSIKSCKIRKKSKLKIDFFYQVFNLTKKTKFLDIWNNQDQYTSFIDLY